MGDTPRVERSAAAPSGVTIGYDVRGENDPAIVFVHGWSCDRSYWDGQVEHFSQTNRVVTIDLAGHGRSGRQRDDWSVAAFGADVATVLDALDLHAAVLVGHSMGAAVIAEAAQRSRSRVGGLVAVDYFFDIGAPTSDADRERMLSRSRPDFRGATDAWVRTLFVARSDPALVDRIARDMANSHADVGLASLDGVMRHNSAEALAKVDAPVYLINSDRRATNLESVRRHKPNAALAILAGSGHFPQLEMPDDFNQALAHAVDELSRTSSH